MTNQDRNQQSGQKTTPQQPRQQDKSQTPRDPSRSTSDTSNTDRR